MSMGEWHETVTKRIRSLLRLSKEEERLPIIEGVSYRPDAFYLKDRRELIIIEAETYFNSTKILDDIVKLKMVEANKLIYIFSELLGEGTWSKEKRVETTRNLAERINKEFCKPITVKVMSLNKAEDLKEKDLG